MANNLIERRRNMMMKGASVDYKSLFMGIIDKSISGDVVIPVGTTKIGQSAFEGCSQMTSVVIPAGITAIYANGFYGNSGLISVELPNTITTFGNGAFSGCTHLESMTFPASVTTIGNNTLNNCSAIQWVKCLATAPPTISAASLGSTSYTYYIYVPDDSVDAYKAAWTGYASRIKALSDFPTEETT